MRPITSAAPAPAATGQNQVNAKGKMIYISLLKTNPY